MDKLYYTIGEAAQTIGEPVSTVRYWTNSLPKFFKSSRDLKGNRRYTADEIETLRQIQYLTKNKGMTIDGTAQFLRDQRGKVARRVDVLECLKTIREQLMEVRSGIGGGQ